MTSSFSSCAPTNCFYLLQFTSVEQDWFRSVLFTLVTDIFEINLTVTKVWNTVETGSVTRCKHRDSRANIYTIVKKEGGQKWVLLIRGDQTKCNVDALSKLFKIARNLVLTNFAFFKLIFSLFGIWSPCRVGQGGELCLQVEPLQRENWKMAYW